MISICQYLQRHPNYCQCSPRHLNDHWHSPRYRHATCRAIAAIANICRAIAAMSRSATPSQHGNLARPRFSQDDNNLGRLFNSAKWPWIRKYRMFEDSEIKQEWKRYQNVSCGGRIEKNEPEALATSWSSWKARYPKWKFQYQRIVPQVYEWKISWKLR